SDDHPRGPTPTDDHPTAEAPAPFGGPRLVLCVDDDAANRMLIARALARRSGYEVELAATGAECVALAARRTPAVILLDWRLPDMTGDAVLAALRADPATRGIPVVILSGMLAPEPPLPDPAGGD